MVRVQRHHLGGFFRQTPRVSFPLKAYGHIDRCFWRSNVLLVIAEIASSRRRTANRGA
jgi:hypothetical protein